MVRYFVSTILSVTFAHVMFSNSKSVAYAVGADTNFPKNISCTLQLKKESSNPLINLTDLPRSCNDFLVSTQRDQDIVASLCQTAASLDIVQFALAFTKCPEVQVAAMCRVPLDGNSNEFADTYYYRSSRPNSTGVTEDELFKSNCSRLGGALIILSL